MVLVAKHQNESDAWQHKVTDLYRNNVSQFASFSSFAFENEYLSQTSGE